MSEPDGQVVENMRRRAEQCRRLAKAILDPRTSEVLLKMAEEVEADIKRLEEGRDPWTGLDQINHQPPVQE